MNDELKAMLLENIKTHLQQEGLSAEDLRRLEKQAASLTDLPEGAKVLQDLRERLAAMERTQDDAYAADAEAIDKAQDLPTLVRLVTAMEAYGSYKNAPALAERGRQRIAQLREQEEAAREAARAEQQRKKDAAQYDQYAGSIDSDMSISHLNVIISFMQRMGDDYREAPDMVTRCRTRIAQLEEEQRLAVLKEKKKKRIIIISVVAAVVLVVGGLIGFSTIEHNNKLKAVEAAIDAGRYADGFQVLQSMGADDKTKALTRALLPNYLMELYPVSGYDGVKAAVDAVQSKGLIGSDEKADYLNGVLSSALDPAPTDDQGLIALCSYAQKLGKDMSPAAMGKLAPLMVTALEQDHSAVVASAQSLMSTFSKDYAATLAPVHDALAGHFIRRLGQEDNTVMAEVSEFLSSCKDSTHDHSDLRSTQLALVNRTVGQMPLTMDLISYIQSLSQLDDTTKGLLWAGVADRAAAASPDPEFTKALCNELAMPNVPLSNVLLYVVSLNDAGNDVASLFPNGILLNVDPMPYVDLIRNNWTTASNTAVVESTYFYMKKVLPVRITERPRLTNKSFSTTISITEKSTRQTSASAFSIRLAPEYYVNLPDYVRATGLDDCEALIVGAPLYAFSDQYVDHQTTTNGRVTSHAYYPIYSMVDTLSVMDLSGSAIYIHYLQENKASVSNTDVKSPLFSPSNSGKMFGTSNTAALNERFNELITYYPLVYLLGN